VGQSEVYILSLGKVYIYFSAVKGLIKQCRLTKRLKPRDKTFSWPGKIYTTMMSQSHIPPVSNKAHGLWWQRQRKGKYFCVKFTQ